MFLKINKIFIAISSHLPICCQLTKVFGVQLIEATATELHVGNKSEASYTQFLSSHTLQGGAQQQEVEMVMTSPPGKDIIYEEELKAGDGQNSAKLLLAKTREFGL